ncbi:hypothetical protein B9J90_13470 [Vibrio sp. V09_P4A23P171]|uniref:hypothetical protein n=1 Tax=Vibrio sp. V09_P4A23P171 TaxID=1938664 RepID=UPI000B8E2D85|nr:hypothetical protein [Vibrio sp. V09_P4A23P171]NCO45024.1 hypothetical protein [Vibrio sp.]OXX34149.1 hypothetical protein B9J90_13470 [Vibrio sp. V09_P4A23P171]
MASLKPHQKQLNKLALYRHAVTHPNITQPIPLPQLCSFVRIAGQLAHEQHALNAQILDHFIPLAAANDPVFVQ